MAAASHLRKVAAAAIDKISNELFELNQKIWKTPELGYNEKHAHKVLTDFVEEKGFNVNRHYTLDTAFRATSGNNKSGRTAGVMCEYDALPAVGHACGHNLIAEAGVAAGIGKKYCLILFKRQDLFDSLFKTTVHVVVIDITCNHKVFFN